MLAVYHRGADYWRKRAIIHWLRQFDAAQRSVILATGAVPIQLEIELESHGHAQQAGVVHRFAFSPVDHRELRVLTTMAIGAAAVIVALLLAVDVSLAMSIIAAACVLALCVSALFCRRALDGLNRVFEVTPFAVSEIHGDGTIRRIMWAGGTTLRNNRRRRRIEVASPSGAFRIDIPYRVVGFAQLVDVIIEKGGFVPENRDSGVADSATC